MQITTYVNANNIWRKSLSHFINIIYFLSSAAEISNNYHIMACKASSKLLNNIAVSRDTEKQMSQSYSCQIGPIQGRSGSVECPSTTSY